MRHPIEYIPICTSRSYLYIKPDKFKSILEMAIKNKDETSLVIVLETVFHAATTVYRHHFLISYLPLNFHKGMISMPTFTVYAYLDAATSGYSGSGPEIYMQMQNSIEENIDDIDHIKLEITDHWEFEELFSKKGPILEATYSYGSSSFD